MLNQPFFQVTLPLMVTFVVTIWAATWSQNKRIEDLRDSINRRLDSLEKRIDEVAKRLDRIDTKLEEFAHRITTLEASKWH
jgi:methyl-accepting chemotaxis protein